MEWPLVSALKAGVSSQLLFLSSTSNHQKSSKDLLLNSLLGHTVASTTKPSMARQRIMEEERVRAVEAYRHLKKQKQQQDKARILGLEKLKNLEWFLTLLI